MRRIDLPPRPDWKATAESLGFGFHTMYGEPYWDESRAWAFSLAEIEDRIEDPSAELHRMCLEAVEHVTAEPDLMRRMAIPEEFHATILDSWRRRDPYLYGRFDLAYDGSGPAKMLEYNADTPTSLYESAFFQWLWLEEMIEAGQLPLAADQFNNIQEALIDRLSLVFPPAASVHFASCGESAEDLQTVRYLEDCAEQAGLFPRHVAVEAIGVDPQGRFVDDEAHLIANLFKLYPLEHMMREDFGRHLIGTRTRIVEPLWKSVLSNKGLLPVLWDLFPGHPNLLPAFFEDDPRCADLGGDHVRKPIFSREGANIEICRGGAAAVTSEGDYGAEGHILQAYAPLARMGEDHMVIGSWIVGDLACGIGIREDRSLITRDLSRFVPHVILP